MLASDFLGCMFIPIIASRVASPAIAYPRKPLQSGSELLQERAGRLEEQSFLPNWRADVRDFHARLFLHPDRVQHLSLFLRAREQFRSVRSESEGKNRVHCDRRLVSTIYPVADCLRGEIGADLISRVTPTKKLESFLSSAMARSRIWPISIFLSRVLSTSELCPDFTGVKHWKRNCEIWEYFSSICDSILFSTIFPSSALRIFVHFNLIFRSIYHSR